MTLGVVVFVVCFTAILYSRSAWTCAPQRNACNHQTDRCTLVPGIDVGSEDIQVLPNGLAFITSGLYRKTPGNIFLFDFRKPWHGVRALGIIGDIDTATFSPHGLNIWRDTNRNLVYLYVVNHNGKKKETVEKFRFDQRRRKLYHLQTFQGDPTFIQLNNLVLIGEDRFYFTNYYKFDFHVEMTQGLPLGNVCFYDGTKGRIVLNELVIPNGIASSPDGKFVYLAVFGEKRVNVYARKADNNLKLIQVVPVCALVDNIDVDVATGDLWIAGHPDVDMFMKHAIPPYTSISPSQVFRLRTGDDGSRVTDVEEVYYNDGRHFSGSSVAVRYRRRMLVGSCFNTMLLCDLCRI